MIGNWNYGTGRRKSSVARVFIKKGNGQITGPEKFNNKTSGVTQRRWLAGCNPGLNALITETIGSGWVTHLDELKKLAPFADDAKFQAQWRQIKLDNKVRLASLVEADCSVTFNTAALFDVQVKRMHEYKRQLLNILHVIHLYDRIKRGDTANWTPRCVLIGGKAAPGYYMAKLIKSRVLTDFHRVWPEKFNNKTNGVTFNCILNKGSFDISIRYKINLFV